MGLHNALKQLPEGCCAPIQTPSGLSCPSKSSLIQVIELSPSSQLLRFCFLLCFVVVVVLLYFFLCMAFFCCCYRLGRQVFLAFFFVDYP